jgi:hypothetical protein
VVAARRTDDQRGADQPRANSPHQPPWIASETQMHFQCETSARVLGAALQFEAEVQLAA